MATPDQFIVDNTDEHWKALEYVRQWCEISHAIDIATGHFELGALLALDGAWQKVDKIRLLIGGETSRRTADLVAEATDRLAQSIQRERQKDDPFLTGAEAVVDAIVSGKIEIRAYQNKKFHAKAYITHGRLDVVGSAALVGSSNFTKPGLTQNVELNVKFQGPEVRDLQAWYEDHWDEAVPVEPDMLKVLEHHAREFTPYEVYAKALHALTAGLDTSDTAWEDSESSIYGKLAPYQRDAYHALRAMAKTWRGGFLTDGVGLGKTFVGLMLTEYYAVRKRMNVLILATKTGKDAVWDPELRERLPHLFGEFTNVIVMAHTDFQRQNAEDLVDKLKDRVDVVIIDEAHNFRNHGSQGDDDKGVPRSRWWRLLDVCRGKIVFNLTATPINNSLFDLVHQAELFTDRDDGYFAAVGVSSLNRYVAGLTKSALKAGETADMTEFDALMAEDKLLSAIIHQSSRGYAIESDKLAGSGTVLFPKTQTPKVVPYDLGMYHQQLLEELEAAFEKKHPLFTLPMYYPLAFSTDPNVDTVAENQQKQVVSLIRTIFLKRFESSVSAFAGSCIDLSSKILSWLTVNTASSPDAASRVEQWIARHQPLLDEVHARYRKDIDKSWQPEEIADDLTEAELEEYEIYLDPAAYDLEAMVVAALEDLTQLARLLERIAEAGELDDKYERLKDLLAASDKKRKLLDKSIFTPEFREQRVLVFTEFADTARYLTERLRKDSIADVDRLDGSRNGDRFKMIKRFAPFYNRVSDEERASQTPLRVLISTDVLSEGVNLQDGTLLINYDLHWNPVRLMQRIGRVDRRMDVTTEKALVEADPGAKKSRGHIQIRNFLPPDDLERLLKLFNRVEGKVVLISKTLGIPGGKLLDESDMHDDVKVMQAFKDERDGDKTVIEQFRLEWLRLVEADPGVAELVKRLPDGISAAKSGDPAGVFVCQRVPVRTRLDEDDETGEWSNDPGRVRWFLGTAGGVVEDLGSIRAAIAAESGESNPGFSDKSEIARVLRALERDMTKKLRKELQMPLNDAPSPETICWMEVR